MTVYDDEWAVIQRRLRLICDQLQDDPAPERREQLCDELDHIGARLDVLLPDRLAQAFRLGEEMYLRQN